MEAHARAGIDIYGSALRYAEVEQYGARYRLLRLGSCDFDFDVTEAVLRTEHPQHLATVSEALADVFSGSVADSYQVTLHPPGCYSFFTPLPAGITDAARRVRLQQEAALLAGVETPLRLTADALYAEPVDEEEVVDWVHVLAVPERIHTRFDRVLRHLPQPRHRLMVSMQAAATAMGRLLRHTEENDADAPYALAIGWYPTHVEYALCRDHRWHFSHFAETGPSADVIYYAAALLRRLHLRPSDVGQVFVYGTDLRTDARPILEALFSHPPRRLNPLAVLDLDPDSLNADFDIEAYVPCLGAAL